MTDRLPEDPHAATLYRLIARDLDGHETHMDITPAQALDLAAGKAIAATVIEDDELDEAA